MFVTYTKHTANFQINLNFKYTDEKYIILIVIKRKTKLLTRNHKTAY